MKQILCSVGLLVSFTLYAGLARANDPIQASPTGSNDCVNSPPCDLQSALIKAGDDVGDDVIQLEGGTYKSTLNSGTFIYDPTKPGTLTMIGPGAIIDTDGHFNNGSPVGAPGLVINTVLFQSSDNGSDITISGITFQNGVASSTNGGAISAETDNASVTLRNCTFHDNFSALSTLNAVGGGAVFVESNGSGSINLIDNSFSDNIATLPGAGAYLFTGFGDVTLIGNSFTGNLSSFFKNSGVQGGGGGALAFTGAGTLTVNRNLFQGNLATLSGGGLAGFSEAGNIIATDNIFSDNQTADVPTPLPQGGGGGAFFQTAVGSIEVINNTFTRNKGTNTDGGALKVYLLTNSSTADLYNNIIRGNLATGTSCAGTCNDVFVEDDGELTGGSTPAPDNIGAPVNVFNNDISDISFHCDPGAGCTASQNLGANIDADPMFVATGSGDFRLLTGSPAIDAGTASAPFLPAKDFAGHVRNQGAAPDMGALESTPPNPPSTVPENCTNNVDDDGDHLIDCLDPDCAGNPACVVPTPTPGTENCANNVDDDGDHLIDCADPDCVGAASCLNNGNPGNGATENCANNVDDDGDGKVDCADPDCSGAAACLGSGGNGQGSNITVNSGGCSLASAPGSVVNLLALLVPLVLAAGLVRNSNAGRRE